MKLTLAIIILFPLLAVAFVACFVASLVSEGIAHAKAAQ